MLAIFELPSVVSITDTMPAPTYIISRVADPIFAVVIGLGAAAGRIKREQKEKGKTTDQTIQDGLRYVTFDVLHAM